MTKAFKEGKDIYATIASLAFNLPYEKCLEFHPETHEYQPDGKARRGEAKTIVLGICYGRSVPSIGDQLFGKDKTMSDEDKTKAAQKVYDAVLNAFPNLRKLMIVSQKKAATLGYTETILGRRRHHPDMQLPEFEFTPLKGYVNPDVDPLNPETLKNKDAIPQRIVNQLLEEFKGYKYFGQIARRSKELYNDQKIKVTNNRPKITEASRAVVNCVDTETEILTVRGWKHFNEIERGDNIYSYNMNYDIFEQDKIIDIVQKNSIFEMYHFKSDLVDIYCTGNHKLVTLHRDMDDRDQAVFMTAEGIYYNSLLKLHTNLLLSDEELMSFYESTESMEITQETKETTVWCVQTMNHTWIARRNGKIFVSGNSIIQGEQHCPYSLNAITQRCAIN